jgi:hypothetical protein
LLDRISAFMETCCFSGERRMEQVTTRILEQSSDAIIVIRHADASVLGTNKTFSAVTGQLEREVVGRPVGDLLVGLRAADGGMAVDAWRDTGSTTDVPAALWTRSGDLRVGQLSVLELEVEGQRIAVCAIRETRNPTQEERRQVARAKAANSPNEPGAGEPGANESGHGTVSDALRNLMGAVGAMTGALERHPVSPTQVEPPALLEELAAGMGKLTRLLEHTTGQDADASLPQEPWPSALPATRLPTGLTLKAVSQRTGIPAATLRTWQRRYGFMQPTRSPSGYRLYGEDEVTLIQQVKYLRDQGVRIGEAMAAVISTGGRPEPGARDEPVGGGSQPR